MDIRNIAIIAHVDHGKTTLVDQLLKQSGAFRENQQVAERAMDSNDLERERGITILAKCTSVMWNDVRINIVDTPGHADFGGEVERILNMVDGALVLVDAAESVLPQTKFVVGKALARGLRPIVVVNKVDRGDARPDEVLNEVFDLFASLDADEKQLDFPVLYASGRQGWADESLEGARENLNPMFDLILRHVAAPQLDKEAPFAMVASILEYDNFLGRILTGRVEQGRAKLNMPVKALRADGSVVETGRLTKLMSFRGLDRVPVEEAEAGDIIAIAGLSDTTVPETIGAPELEAPLVAIPVDPPTLAMTFRVNDGPLAGREGKKVTSRQIRDRLMREAEGNIAIRISESSESDAFEVAGRGELQLGVLIETMRREGFELAIGRPRVLFRETENGREEPMEEVLVDVDEPYSGVVVEKMSRRKGELREMRPSGGGKVRLTFLIPSRGLIGYHGEFLTDTRGTGIMNRLFSGYGPYKGTLEGRRNGSLISNSDGEAVQYALFALQDRGVLFVDPGEKVYVGMIIGEHSRENDLDVNPIKEKKLTNIRAAGKDEALLLVPPRKMSLEQAIAYIEDDELVEVTPSAVRLRKRHLDPNERKKAQRSGDAA
ncbi:translational GTPase TypA [Granulibacter bethesdensis]|uniref:Large ribosomal subunit assembly factor BipA n=2 Tax=Granulibacter bethesdensis TaxID=364410 RepID=Q0BQ84_GRABC|nr:translational GTPase TypA [Granulibacter bethesdensis]ABI63018.1 GTP-binding protein TypA/BipA [Granulibacter bethesdensis CGDNIH1]AHJ64016.1 GTP-binding protein TypA/BipA [Granulibacter bethesdensis]AHJ65401.1 GTP-binding protein TypA/BipA [Granulibacter bethesdensis CGDNIH4]AHJ68019.1 GTP-binding protein TypA/BipA [Granulibacter bethesdensis]APH52890.1 GTP-binding protein TypA/BipA [Granulibacter bethesdensis]